MFLRFFLLILSSVILYGCQTTSSVQSRVVAAFDDMIYNPAPDLWSGQIEGVYPHPIRWETNKITYAIKWIDLDPIDELEIEVKYQISEFNRLTGIKLVEINDSDAPDLKIVIDNEDGYIINGNQRAACYADTDFDDETYEITKAEIRLPGAKVKEAKNCVSHELMHAFGFGGHTIRLRSVMNNPDALDGKLSRWDEYIISGLYLSTLKLSMSRSAVLKEFEIYLGGKL